MKRYVLAAVAALALMVSMTTTAFALPVPDRATEACELIAEPKAPGEYDCPS